MAGHVGILVELQLVRPVHPVHGVDVLYVGLEHVETPPFLIEVAGGGVVAPPPLVQVPQAFIGAQVLLREVDAPREAESRGYEDEEQENVPSHRHV